MIIIGKINVERILIRVVIILIVEFAASCDKKRKKDKWDGGFTILQFKDWWYTWICCFIWYEVTKSL